MKTRESGMPPEEMWRTFFDPPAILTTLGLTAAHRSVIDFGCGFGTFSIPAAQIVSGMIHALDIDPEMVEATRRRAAECRLRNVAVECRDFIEAGCGQPDGSADFAMLFNILHAAEARTLLADAHRVLSPSGTLAVIHWNDDPRTPRGPSMAIRQSPSECRALVESAGFIVGPLLRLPPHHYGFAAVRSAGGGV